MSRREELKTVWLKAYNAALTGLLANNAHINFGLATDNATKAVAEICTRYANQAVKDFAEYENLKSKSEGVEKPVSPRRRDSLKQQR